MVRRSPPNPDYETDKTSSLARFHIVRANGISGHSISNRNKSLFFILTGPLNVKTSPELVFSCQSALFTCEYNKYIY